MATIKMKLMDAIVLKHPYLKNTNGQRIEYTAEMAAEIKTTYKETGSYRATAKKHKCAVKTVHNALDGEYDEN